MESHRFPIVATLIVAGIASSLADTEAAASLSNKNLRGIGSRRLQDGPDVIVPLLAMTGGLSRCQGDCASDEDCAAGLVCWYDFDGSGKVPGCSGTAQPDAEYCIDPDDVEFVMPGSVDDASNKNVNAGPGLMEIGALNRCEGDCDYDEDCAEGLVCWYDEDETGELPPGCAGTPQPGSEYCIDPRAPPYVFPKILKDRVGLDACVGDCDYDEDCADGMVCWWDDGSGKVPGCSGTPQPETEYCVDPDTIPPTIVTHSDTLDDFAVSAGPGSLGRCQGDCDEDVDCEGDNVCYYLDGESGVVPGCDGTPTSEWEYCADPKAIEEYASQMAMVETQSQTTGGSTCVPPGGICEFDDMGDPISMCCSPDNVCVDSRCVVPDPPTDMPTGKPTVTPTSMPTAMPTSKPTSMPTAMPIESVNNSNSSLTERPLLTICEGDCDYDEDCSDGLVCWNDIDGSGVVPGCSGSPVEGWEYCIDPNATASVEPDSTAPSLTETDPLDRCVGDCDWDSDCSEGLICWYDEDETGVIPGCPGTPMDEFEYCIDPVDIPFKNATHSDTVVDISTSLGPGEYGRCQGDCDEDIDCEGELVCFFPNDAIRIVPGCKGRPSSGWEYCADPKDVEDHAKRFGVDVTQVKSAPSDDAP